MRREDLMSEEESEIIMWEERPHEPIIVDLSDSVGRLTMIDSLSVGTLLILIARLAMTLVMLILTLIDT